MKQAKIRIDSQPLLQAIFEATTLLENALKLGAKIPKGFSGIFDVPSKLCCIKRKPTPRTLNAYVIQPSNRFRDFLTTLRAISS